MYVCMLTQVHSHIWTCMWRFNNYFGCCLSSPLESHWPGTHLVDWTGWLVNPKDPSVSTAPVLGLQMSTTTSGCLLFLMQVQGPKIKSLCLHGKELSHWATFPAVYKPCSHQMQTMERKAHPFPTWSWWQPKSSALTSPSPDQAGFQHLAAPPIPAMCTSSLSLEIPSPQTEPVKPVLLCHLTCVSYTFCSRSPHVGKKGVSQSLTSHLGLNSLKLWAEFSFCDCLTKARLSCCLLARNLSWLL